MLSMVSCVKDSDSETTLYDEAAITTFKLGTLNRYTTTVYSEDSIVTKKTTFTGSNYKFVIDQINHRIYNPDSLPIGTDPAHVICSITTAKNSVALIKSINDGSEDLYSYYSTSDSIDFSVPRVFRVVSSDGTGYTDYTVEVNVHKEIANEWVWDQLTTSSTLATMKGMKAFLWDETIYLFGQQNNQTKLYTTTNGINYTQLTTAPTLGADAWKNVIQWYSRMYVLDGTTLYATEDGTTWDVISYQTSKPIKQLLGTSYTELYALSAENTLLRSDDLGSTWIDETYDESPLLLPTEDASIVSYPVNMADNSEQVMLVGNRSTTGFPKDNCAVVWRKIIDYNNLNESGIWTYIDRGGDERLTIPRAKNINLLRYEESTLAFFGEYYNGNVQPYNQFLQSRDNGITWKNNNDYLLPQFGGIATYVTSVVDLTGHIWIFSAGTGEVWRGRMNRVAWEF